MATTLVRRSARWLEEAARSVWRVGWPRTDKDRAAVMISSFFLHVHPARVSRHVLRPSYTLGLGLVSAILFGVLTVIDRHGTEFVQHEGEGCVFVPLIGRHGWGGPANG